MVSYQRVRLLLGFAIHANRHRFRHFLQDVFLYGSSYDVQFPFLHREVRGRAFSYVEEDRKFLHPPHREYDRRR